MNNNFRCSGSAREIPIGGAADIHADKAADRSVGRHHLDYEQKVKSRLLGYRPGKITLVHIGEKLIILFDNQST